MNLTDNEKRDIIKLIEADKREVGLVWNGKGQKLDMTGVFHACALGARKVANTVRGDVQILGRLLNSHRCQGCGMVVATRWWRVAVRLTNNSKHLRW